MKSYVRIKLALVAALLGWLSGGVGEGYAQESRTTLDQARALIDLHLERGANETDPTLKRRLQIEGDLAVLSLPAGVRQYEVADRLRRLKEELSDGRSPDSDVIWDGLDGAKKLAKRRNDFERLAVINRQYYDARGWGGEGQYLQRLILANDPQALAWFIQTEKPGYASLDGFCEEAPRDLVRQTALRLTDPEMDEKVARVLADLGEFAEAERRADRQMVRAPGKMAAVGPGILVRLAILASLRGDARETHRLVRKLMDLSPTIALSESSSIERIKSDACAPGIYKKIFLKDWLNRSVQWISSYPLSVHPRIPPNTPGTLGRVVAGASADPQAIALVDRMITLLDGFMRERGIDDANAALLAFTERGTNTPPDAGVTIYSYWLRQSLKSMRVAAGAAIDDDLARSLSLEWFVEFLGDFPRSDLAQRILALSEDERRSMNRLAPGLLPKVQFASFVLTGKGTEAIALRASDAAGIYIYSREVLYLIEMMENAGLRDRARTALDAYLEVYPRSDLAVLRLLLFQGRVEQAKAMMRDFAAGDSTDKYHVFFGAMLLLEIGEVVDIDALFAARLSADPVEAGRRLLEIADAFAWQGASDEIAKAVSHLHRLLPAPLSDEDAACVHDSLVGLQAVSLARRGDLEGGYRLVADRNLERRQFCSPGMGYSRAKPIFDLRYLVQQWAQRGHAVP